MPVLPQEGACVPAWVFSEGLTGSLDMVYACAGVCKYSLRAIDDSVSGTSKLNLFTEWLFQGCWLSVGRNDSLTDCKSKNERLF